MDVSTDEMLRFLVGMRAASAVSLGEVLDHVKATAAINAENTADARRSAAQGSDAILRSDSVFQSGLLKAFSLETDNEVLSTAALAQLIDGLLDKRIEALAAAQG
jgi:hypothetical protein